MVSVWCFLACYETAWYKTTEKKQRDCLDGVKEPSGADNEIWSFGERNYPILKELIELRERLITYIMHCMREASQTGTPVMRPMFFDYFNNVECYTLCDQYMFGGEILFALILSEGQTVRKVYLPEGQWIRTKDKSIHIGGRYVECEAKIDEFIAFVKQGSGVIDVF